MLALNPWAVGLTGTQRSEGPDAGADSLDNLL